MFDLKTFKVLGRIPAAEDADAIIYDAVSDRVFTFNGDAHSSTVIDPRAGSLITNVPLGGKPEYGVSAGDGRVYANLTDTSEVVEIDAKTAVVLRRWPTAPCKQPVAMAIDTGHHRLFSGCRSGVLAVSDYQAGKIVASAPIGAGVDGRRVRFVRRRRVCVRRGRHADRDSSGRPGPVSRGRDAADPTGIEKHGARSDHASHLHCGGDVRAGAGRRPRPRRRGRRIVRSAGRRAIAIVRRATPPAVTPRAHVSGFVSRATDL